MTNFGHVIKYHKLPPTIAKVKVVIDMQILVIFLVTNLSFSTSVHSPTIVKCSGNALPRPLFALGKHDLLPTSKHFDYQSECNVPTWKFGKECFLTAFLFTNQGTFIKYPKQWISISCYWGREHPYPWWYAHSNIGRADHQLLGLRGQYRRCGQSHSVKLN